MTRYYGHLVTRQKNINRRLRWTAAFVSSGSLVAFLLARELQPWVTVPLIVAAATNIWLAVSRHVDSITFSVDMYRQLSRIAIEWQDLWADVYVESDQAIRERWKDLSKRTSDIVADAPSKAEFVEKLAIQSEEECYKYWDQVYAKA